MSNDLRLLRALSRDGLEVRRDGAFWSVRLHDDPDGPPAEVLLPADLPLEKKALHQLAALASVRHPGGGGVVAAVATPDFHPGDSGIAIGSVVETEDAVIPAAIGTDINCGMRLHVADLSVDRLLSVRDALVASLTGDYLLGTRDLPMPGSVMRAMFQHGLPGWLDAAGRDLPGQLRASDPDQLLTETDRVMLGGGQAGDVADAPEDLVPEQGQVRDAGLATIGGGNHFVELGEVEEVLDRQLAYEWGLQKGKVSVLIHSGSRLVGKGIGSRWMQRAKEAWPAGVPHPRSRIFPLSLQHTPELVAGWLRAEATAANYGFLNRMLLAELLRLRLREQLGSLELPLICDIPHNITLPEGRGWVARKGACPAHEGQPVLIPGSMGTSSYVAVGLGAARTLCSASHGAGRAHERFAMGRAHGPEALGLDGVDCVTLRPERRVEEAPAAYKPIESVMRAQVDAGVLRVVAKLRPVLTFKA